MTPESTTQQQRLTGQVAIITGSTGGMGEGIARRLAAEGAAVVISGRRAVEGQRVADTIREAGGQAVFVQADIAGEADCIYLIQSAVEQFGRLDILVNNAAITPDEPLLGQPVELWDAVYAVNTRGPFLLCREAIPVMQRRGGGRIINIGSTVPLRGDARRLAYGTSKGALLAMTKMLARGLVGDHILVNWIAVGWVATPGEVALRDQLHGNGAVFLAETGKETPLGRLETVEEIAAGVAYLCSEEASHITGCELNISGGLWI